jgi:2-polyprenyl-6-methoxyphenol hydroxylase-like FAD-dependent oxidoreductase
MTVTQVDTDIVIVGAGPVGLFLANECARRGLRYRLIEERPSQSQHSKALAIFPRTMEIFDMAGLAAPFLNVANRVTAVSMITHGHTLAHMQFEPHESPYSFVAMVPQNVTEQLLAEELQRRGGTVEYQSTFVSAEEHDDYVNVTLDHAGKMVRLKASFVIGCDGAHSTVRHLLKIPFEGGEYDATFLLADAETNDFLPVHELQLCPNESGPLAIFPMTTTRRRVIATIDNPEGDAPSLELVKKVASERAPKGFEVLGLNWSSYFRIHHRHVAHLREGRLFIAGDAAHIHSPFGGQGMNTGLQDIWNLIWKLDLVLNGRGNDQLLDSYTAERLPVIKSVIESTDFLTKVMGTPNKLAQALRNTIIPMVSRLAPFQHAFVQRLSELGIAYHGSPIVEGPGKRYFDESLRGGTGIRSRFLLMIGDAANSSIKNDAAQLCESVKDVVELRSSKEQGITLVRPDGYIAYASHKTDDTGALRSVRSILELQTAPNVHANSSVPAARKVGASTAR